MYHTQETRGVILGIDKTEANVLCAFFACAQFELADLRAFVDNETGETLSNSVIVEQIREWQELATDLMRDLNRD
jgi:hypothetical protein